MIAMFPEHPKGTRRGKNRLRTRIVVLRGVAGLALPPTYYAQTGARAYLAAQRNAGALALHRALGGALRLCPVPGHEYRTGTKGYEPF